ncbi:hypothetical protein [Ancylobacter radicis]|uniref:Uncharacterized protein n=1 Tax=Ancylobacter radicis TaxID=2836179 RepID=A0ABS5RC65_9HYPH|nr:hypothetical protein [Ancylobacter radicis]MBS9478424.1 hypothetical protein [Ancylobacter radicis]
MSTSTPEGHLIPGIGVIETTESDNILRWDGDELYVEQDVYHNGQIVHRKYRRRVTKQVAHAIARMLAEH